MLDARLYADLFLNGFSTNTPLLGLDPSGFGSFFFCRTFLSRGAFEFCALINLLCLEFLRKTGRIVCSYLMRDPVVSHEDLARRLHHLGDLRCGQIYLVVVKP